MINDQVKLNVDEVIASLQTLDNKERAKLINALAELQNDLDLKDVIQGELADIKSGKVSSHAKVMKDIKEKHNS